MGPCTVKWLIIGTCLLITLTGLWLAVLREIRNIKSGKKDIQKILYDKKNGTFNFSLAIGVLLIGGGLYAAIYTETNNIGCNTQNVDRSIQTEVKVARILFKLDYNDSIRNLVLHQNAPKIANRNIVIQEGGYYKEYIDIPKIGDTYTAAITRKQQSNVLGYNDGRPELQMCFERNDKDIRDDGVIAILRAGEDKTFIKDHGDPGCVNLCDVSQSSIKNSFHLFPRAYAQPNLNENKFYGWAVPNLQTLQEERRTGFSEISIDSKILNTELKEANRYFYSVKINDTPIFFDGLLPKYILNPFDYEEGLHIEFGVENLGFSGNVNGYENIEININFYRHSEFLKSLPLKINYVALRKNEPQEIVTNEGSEFEWKALFSANQENQIFIGSMPTVEGAVYTKKRLNNKSLNLNGNNLIGVIRPPYQDNTSYGVCVGLVLPNKQIQFTFKYSEAEKIKAYLKNNSYRPLIRSLSDN